MTHVFLAGQESWYELFFEVGVPFQLGTYYYLQRSKNRGRILAELERQKRQKPGFYRYFLDSGAFTIGLDAENGKADPDAIRKYAKQYIDFVREHYELFDIIAELDLDGVDVEWGEIDEWRSQLLDAAGSRVCVVWHPVRGMDKWKEHIHDSRVQWVGLASDVMSEFGLGRSMALAAQARRQGKYVHAFGQTRVATDMKFMRVESQDSTSWLRATQYGTTFVFKGNKLTAFNAPRDSGKKQSFRRTHKRYFEKLGLNYEKILNDEASEVAKAACVAWRDFALRMHTVGKSNGLSNLNWSHSNMPKKIITGVDLATGPDVTVETVMKGGQAVRTSVVRGKVRIPLLLLTSGELSVDESSMRQSTQNDPPEMAVSDDDLPAPERPKERERTGRIAEISAALRGEQPQPPSAEQQSEGCPVCGNGRGPAQDAPVIEGMHVVYPTVFYISLPQHDGTQRIGHGRCWKAIGMPERWPEELTKNEPAATTVTLTSSAEATPINPPNDDAKIGEGKMPPRKEGTDTTETQGEQEGTTASQEASTKSETAPSGNPPSGQSVNIPAESRGRGHNLPVLGNSHNLAVMTKNDLVDAAVGALPKMACSTCSMQGECPEFREGYVCAFTELFAGMTTRDPANVFPMMRKIVDLNVQRAFVAYAQEQATAGGQIDPRVSAQFREAMDGLQKMLEMQRALDPQRVGSRVLVEERNDGSIRVEAEGKAAKGGGVLSRLFGAPRVHDAMEAQGEEVLDGVAVEVQPGVTPGGTEGSQP